MFNFEKISASKFYTAPSVERVVEFSPQDVDMSNVAKVLSLAVDAKSTTVEAHDGYVQVSGRTNFRLIYIDKEGVARGVDYNADFEVRVDGEFAEGDNARCDIYVTEADVGATDRLSLTAVLDIRASAIKRDEIEMLTSCENCYTVTKEIFVPSFIATKTSSVPFDDEVNVGGEISAVLGLNTVCIAKQSVATDGGAKTKFQVIANVTYVENGEIKQRAFNIPIEDEFSLDGVTMSDAIKVEACIKTAKVVLQGVTDDNIIRVEGEVQIKVGAFRCSKTEIVSDLFMLSNETEIERKSANYQCFDGCGYFVQGVSGTAMLGDNKPAALQVCAMPYARCYTTRSYVTEDNRLVAEGVVNTDIIYTDENGYNAVRAEIPFAVAVASEIPFSKEVRVHCDVQRIDANVVREREFDIVMDIAVKACGYSDLQADYISAVTVGEARVTNTSALSVYVASEGEEMLDICKALSAMPGDVIAQNPTLETPTKEGDKIVYFRALKQ